MPFVSGLYTWLASQAGITSITGTAAATRIYPLYAPQLDLGADIQPTLLYSQISRSDIEKLQGTAMRKTDFEFVSMAMTHEQAHLLNDALEAALNNYQGAMGAYQCRIARLQDSSDEIVPEQGVFAVISRYSISHDY
jgi:hypothetical protein